MSPSFRLTIRYAATWRLLAELLRRRQTEHDLRLHWHFPGSSGNGIVEVRRNAEILLALDVTHGELWTPAAASATSAGDDEVDIRSYVAALMAADDPKVVVDALERVAGLRPRHGTLPASNAPVLCARVIAGVLERRNLARVPTRTTPGYLGNAGSVHASGWIDGLPELQALIDASRASRPGGGVDESGLVQHVFALHTGEGLMQGTSADYPPFVAFDLRAGVVHAIHGHGRRSSLAMPEALAQAGGRLGPLIDWVDLCLP